MKLLMTLFIIIAFVKAGAQTNAEGLSYKIAQRLQDSLSLKESQRIQLYEINMRLHEQKMDVWRQALPVDSLQVRIQEVENQRDALYKAIFTRQQYELYRNKKRNLVSNH